MSSSVEQNLKALLATYKKRLTESKNQTQGFNSHEDAAFEGGKEYTLESVIEDLEKLVPPDPNPPTTK